MLGDAEDDADLSTRKKAATTESKWCVMLCLKGDKLLFIILFYTVRKTRHIVGPFKKLLFPPFSFLPPKGIVLEIKKA